ncbi:protein of unknown function [Candidatus Methylomirabilis oxygeniifera]|uniref:Uncharacterized protein n=1 Tax=Methylomirabilis oxygeniifera TaxID=671143 RepID=D5MHR5_METO1|nr:protein of unknown function [Candidatus Methylomirabilis oxyfera]
MLFPLTILDILSKGSGGFAPFLLDGELVYNILKQSTELPILRDSAEDDLLLLLGERLERCQEASAVARWTVMPPPFICPLLMVPSVPRRDSPGA